VSGYVFGADHLLFAVEKNEHRNIFELSLSQDKFFQVLILKNISTILVFGDRLLGYH
jgi:hypothetical protein